MAGDKGGWLRDSIHALLPAAFGRNIGHDRTRRYLDPFHPGERGGPLRQDGGRTRPAVPGRGAVLVFRHPCRRRAAATDQRA
ncbi:hypothetical protein MTBSS4_10021 [Magnetospirillum sp. SS-4]|nr:hypothetical protein MTBSS4_10021 [Magnetospirillum sp. SS-4]